MVIAAAIGEAETEYVFIFCWSLPGHGEPARRVDDPARAHHHAAALSQARCSIACSFAHGRAGCGHQERMRG
jgi:hypothetical protein